MSSNPRSSRALSKLHPAITLIRHLPSAPIPTPNPNPNPNPNSSVSSERQTVHVETRVPHTSVTALSVSESDKKESVIDGLPGVQVKLFMQFSLDNEVDIQTPVVHVFELVSDIVEEGEFLIVDIFDADNPDPAPDEGIGGGIVRHKDASVDDPNIDTDEV